MKGYVLSVIGVVFLGVLVDVIMPDGEMNKYVKGMFSLIALCVLLSPVKKIFNKNYSFDSLVYDSSAIQIDYDFIESTNKQIKQQLERSLEAKLCDAGFDNTKVEILCDLSNNKLQIKKVVVDISKMVINANMAHINKYTEIKGVITKNLNVEESDVIINEWRKKANKR